MNLIVSINNKNVIGSNNKLLWNCKSDLAWFRSLTLGKVCHVGHNTYHSLGGELKDRTLRLVEEPVYEAGALVIGGAATYLKYLKAGLIDVAYITYIDNDLDGDTKLNYRFNGITIPIFSKRKSEIDEYGLDVAKIILK